MEINDKAPDFTSLDQNGEKIALKDYKRQMGRALFLSSGGHAGMHH